MKKSDCVTSTQEETGWLVNPIRIQVETFSCALTIPRFKSTFDVSPMFFQATHASVVRWKTWTLRQY